MSSAPGVATDVVIVGAGGFGRETAEVLRATTSAGFRPVGFLDDDEAIHGERVAGLPVLGAIDWLTDKPNVHVVVCVGSPRNYFVRKRVVRRLGLSQDRYVTVIHPSAIIPASGYVAGGSVLMAGVVLTADVHIGRHVSVMPGVVFTHDDVVHDFATFGAGVHLAGGVTIGEGAYIGAGALLREGVAVGAWSLVGMGSVVLGDIPGGEIWAGVPARRLRKITLPGDVGSS